MTGKYSAGILRIAIVVCLIALVWFAGCTSSANAPSTVVTTDQAAIIAAANNCTPMTVTITDDVATYQETSANCSFTKTLVQLNPGETQQMKTLLEGKNMTCLYTKGNFDPRLVTSLIGGIENCTGDLKDDISRLTIFT